MLKLSLVENSPNISRLKLLVKIHQIWKKISLKIEKKIFLNLVDIKGSLLKPSSTITRGKSMAVIQRFLSYSYYVALLCMSGFFVYTTYYC